MRVVTLLLLVAVALVPAGAAATVRSVQAPAPVVALAADGPRVAFAAGASARDCDRVRVWNLTTRGVSQLGRSTPCERTSTGTGVASLGLAGTRVLWLHYTGGNLREWRLFTATTSAPRPRLLRTVVRDVDAPAPVVVGTGDTSPRGDLLPYAVDRDVVVLRVSGARRFAWRAPARVVALAARDGRLAVATAGGDVTVLDAAGRVVRREALGRELDAVALAGDDTLVVQHGRTLELRGGRVALYALLPGARLADAAGDRAAILHRGRVSVLDLDDGSAAGSVAGTLARLEGARLATASGRTVAVR